MSASALAGVCTEYGTHAPGGATHLKLQHMLALVVEQGVGVAERALELRHLREVPIQLSEARAGR